MSEKIKALLATGRISNLPTVWCNCLAAALILFHQSEKGFLEFVSQPWSEPLTYLAIFLVVITSCFYVGGCFMGDYIDREFDAKHKPERPIPSGILHKYAVLAISTILSLCAFLGAGLLPYLYLEGYSSRNLFLPIMFLAFSISWYSQYHKKSLFIGLPLIGLCRFTLVLFAASTASLLLSEIKISAEYTSLILSSYLITPIILYASAVCLYTICFASVARTESSDSPITWRKVLRYTMLGLPLLAVVSKGSFFGIFQQTPAIVAVAIYAVWLIHSFSYLSRNKGVYVSKCLAGFCLLDACFVAQFGWMWLIICLVLFACSLALQKIAPAT